MYNDPDSLLLTLFIEHCTLNIHHFGANMSDTTQIIYLARHGETAWSLTGQHTGLTDLPLTEHGERNARQLGQRLQGLAFAQVFTSPLQRAHRTCELAGFGSLAVIDADLVEWNYGEYEGKTAAARFTICVATG